LSDPTSSRDIRISLFVRSVVFLAALAFFAYSAFHAPGGAKAAALQWVIRGPAQTADPWSDSYRAAEFGWHFDETGNWGGKDFSGGINNNAILWAQMMLDSGWWWHYTVTDYGMCGAQAYAAYTVDGYQWYGVPGLDLRFLHLDSVNSGWTGYMHWNGEQIWYVVGTMATSGNCRKAGTHVHLSADLADLDSNGKYLYRVNHTQETCWTDTTSKCSAVGNYSRRDNTNYSCPPGAYSTGSFPRTGTVMGPTGVYDGRYALCTWQIMWRPQYYDVFQAWF